MKITRRKHVINYIVKQRKYERYLEIGVRDPSLNFDYIKCSCKDGVDPDSKSNCKYVMTSDDFFEKISKYKMYDIIFIDGLHLYKQVLRDIENSLNHLNPKGTIVVHDCNPISKKAQLEDRNEVKKWNGTVWKSFALLRMSREDLEMYVVDVNQGCGIIRRGSQKLFKKKYKDKLNYNFLKRNRKKLLNLCSAKKFCEKERNKSK